MEFNENAIRKIIDPYRQTIIYEDTDFNLTYNYDTHKYIKTRRVNGTLTIWDSTNCINFTQIASGVPCNEQMLWYFNHRYYNTYFNVNSFKIYDENFNIIADIDIHTGSWDHFNSIMKCLDSNDILTTHYVNGSAIITKIRASDGSFAKTNYNIVDGLHSRYIRTYDGTSYLLWGGDWTSNQYVTADINMNFTRHNKTALPDRRNDGFVKFKGKFISVYEGYNECYVGTTDTNDVLTDLPIKDRPNITGTANGLYFRDSADMSKPILYTNDLVNFYEIT